MMRKLIYHFALTLDGFIAHEDHTIDGVLLVHYLVSYREVTRAVQ